MKTRIFIVAAILLATVALQGCKHPLVIVGEGDIVDANNSGYGCTLEQFQAQDTACTENEVSGDYFVNYKAEPRPGWRFVRWDGPCAPRSNFQYCRLNIGEPGVVWWDETHPDAEIPPSTAVFAPITGKTGFLVGPAVAGVFWETATQQGVTGLDGRFQYEKGETVRFKIGDTLLGEVTGQAQVTPFDLAGSAVITGTPDIRDALESERNPFGDVTNLDEKKRDPFHAVVNIAVLLQTLDHDADPGNGIEIRRGVAALFRRLSLDVGQHWKEFQIDFGLRHALGQANKKRRFSKAHGVVNPAPALQQLYETLGIDAQTLAVSLEQRDEDGNGVPENIKTWQYNTSGNVTRYEEDNDSDGTPETIVTWQYDANGNVTRHDGSGAPGVISTYQYDALGNVTHSETDVGDGVLVDFRNYEYDANGNVTREERDDGGDGTTDRIDIYKYDARGRLTRQEKYLGSEHDGYPDLIDTWQYNANGNVTRHEEMDSDGDGTPNRIETWQYDANDNVTRHEVDRHGDGTLVQIYTWQYDANGNETRWESDRDADGTPDVITSHQYDSNGNVTRYEGDGDGDGTPETILTWQYDVNDNVTRGEEDNDGDGTPDAINTYQYDANGNVTQKNDNCHYRYDMDDYLMQEEGDCAGDGMPSNLVTYEYEATGWGHIFAD